MATADSLITLALARIAELTEDDARVAALRALARAVNDIQDPPDGIDEVYGRILALGATLSRRSRRARAFEDACKTIAASSLPVGRRRELLDHALERALETTDVVERVANATAALEARLQIRYEDRTEELLELLFAATEELQDEDAKGHAVLRIVMGFARLGERERSLACAGTMPTSGRRALAFSGIVAAADDQGDRDEAAWLFVRALAETREAPPSAERTSALAELLAYAVHVGGELGSENSLAAALEVVASLDSADAEREALLRAITALPDTTRDDAALADLCAQLSAAIDRVDDLDMRVELRGRLAVGLVALGEIDTSIYELQMVGYAVGRMRAAGIDGPHASLPIALPIVEILELLAGVDLPPADLERFAAGALDLLDVLHDSGGVAALLGAMTRFFANPALAYPSRVALLDRALGTAHRIAADDTRIEVIAHVANALSAAGATERGDALFAGLVGGIGSLRARRVRLMRAVALVPLGRTPEARAEIAAAVEMSEQTLADVEENAVAMARCGFLGDMLTEIARIDPSRQHEPRARIADKLVEATYLDPHLRDVGLSSLLGGAEGPVRDTVACLLDQLRVLQGLGDVAQILEQAFARTATLPDRRAASIFDRQLVDALIERIRSVALSTG